MEVRRRSIRALRDAVSRATRRLAACDVRVRGRGLQGCRSGAKRLLAVYEDAYSGRKGGGACLRQLVGEVCFTAFSMRMTCLRITQRGLRLF